LHQYNSQATIADKRVVWSKDRWVMDENETKSTS
jgi:hypothetical protein